MDIGSTLGDHVSNKRDVLVSQTSVDAYYRNLESGLLSVRRRQIYEAIKVSTDHGEPDVTTQEVYRDFQTTYRWKNLNSINGRFSELESMGIIEACGVRTCRATGERAKGWRLTNRDAVPFSATNPTRKTPNDVAIASLNLLSRMLAGEKTTRSEVEAVVNDPVAEAMRKQFYKKYIKSERWKQVRAQSIKRANGICQRCGVEKAVQAHHLSYARVGDEPPEDLLAVCRPCHHQMHPEKWSHDKDS